LKRRNSPQIVTFWATFLLKQISNNFTYKVGFRQWFVEGVFKVS
jgi:hypothetical protein